MTGIARRDFIATTLATAGAALVTGKSGLALGGAPAAVEAWYDRTMRWVQLILVENDPGRFDPDWWLGLCKRSHADGLCLTAGGLVAYYPTEVPFHHRSKWMKDGDDPFGYLVAGCRKLGMTIVARTDSHSCLDDAAAAHPEWLNVDENGAKRRHWEMPETRWITCALGPYNFEFMTKVHEEIVRKYGIDGLFCNRWQAQARGMCYCESCQRLFRADSGLDLPRSTDPLDPVTVRYNEWVQKRLVELWRLWDAELRKRNPQARYFSNTGLDIERAAELAPTYLCERQSRGNQPPWSFGRRGKEMRAVFGAAKPIIALAGITSSSRQSVTTEAEARIWLVEAIANGLRPWFLKTSGLIPDGRWVPAIEKVYEWHWRNEKYLRNEANLARAALVYAPTSEGALTAIGPGRRAVAPGRPATGTPPAEGRPAAAGDAASGMYQALIEARIPFETVYTRRLDPQRLDQFKVLILPNVTSLSEGECDQLRQYVARGGSLVATHQTSLYDGVQRRNSFGLADLFGVAFDGRVDGNGPNSYMRLEHETKHPILQGLDGVSQIVNTGQRVAVRAVAAFGPPPLTRIPSYPTIPMEEIYPRQPKTDIPEVYLREMGKSRVVYFPGDIDGTFSSGMEVDHATIIRNAVNWAMDEVQPVSVSGPGIVEVTCWRQAASMTVHLVNMTNPMMLRAAYREAIPISEQRVSIRLPAGRTARAVRLLVGGQTPRVERQATGLVVTVPSIVDHEVVAIDF
jgi:hypothetical protein